MSTMLSKTSIIKKTVQVGGITLISRLLGLVREIIQARFLGATFLADAFVTAFKIPNSLRKIFAEGALSAAFVPVIVKTQVEGDKKAVNSLMTLSLLIFEGVLILLCLLIFFKAEAVIRIISPGWYTYDLPSIKSETSGYFTNIFHTIGIWIYPDNYHIIPGAHVAYAVKFLKILISFIIFISCSALFSGALHSVNHFFVPAFSPIILNIIYISGLLTCTWFGLSIETLCWFILGAGLIQFLLHIIAYIHFGFSFGPITKDAYKQFRFVLSKFFPCIVSMSVMEISLFIDTSLASFLPSGSMMIIYLANRFIGIPLGVFANAFSTILLPHFSRVNLRSPQRFSFYLLETTKFVLWVTIPVTLLLTLWSYNIFLTLFLSSKFPLPKILEASQVLQAFTIGLFFFSINKILLSLYYALHETRTPTIISIIATILNFVINLLLLNKFKATGLAFATTISAIVQTILFVWYLHKKFNITLHKSRLTTFLISYTRQLIVIGALFGITYKALLIMISLLPITIANLLLSTALFWFWAGPLAFCSFLALYKTRHYFNVRLFFAD